MLSLELEIISYRNQFQIDYKFKNNRKNNTVFRRKQNKFITVEQGKK